MKNKPVWDYSDKRASYKHQIEEGQRRKERRIAEKKMGRNYFTNIQEIIANKLAEEKKMQHSSFKRVLKI